MKKTFKAWNGTSWETFKSFEEACSMLSKKFNQYIKNNEMSAAADMDRLQIRVNTGEDEYSFAQVEIIKGDFTVKKFNYEEYNNANKPIKAKYRRNGVFWWYECPRCHKWISAGTIDIPAPASEYCYCNREKITY